MTLTKKQAKALSIKKWEIIIEKGGDYTSEDLPREILKLSNHCGYCEKHFAAGCIACPLSISMIGDCNDIGHPWNTWSKDMTLKNAQVVLDLIKKS